MTGREGDYPPIGFTGLGGRPACYSPLQPLPSCTRGGRAARGPPANLPACPPACLRAAGRPATARYSRRRRGRLRDARAREQGRAREPGDARAAAGEWGRGGGGGLSAHQLHVVLLLQLWERQPLGARSRRRVRTIKPQAPAEAAPAPQAASRGPAVARPGCRLRPADADRVRPPGQLAGLGW